VDWIQIVQGRLQLQAHDLRQSFKHWFLQVVHDYLLTNPYLLTCSTSSSYITNAIETAFLNQSRIGHSLTGSLLKLCTLDLDSSSLLLKG
jgi:hypothetical protein